MDHPPKKSTCLWASVRTAQWCPITDVPNKGSVNGRLVSHHCFVIYKRHDNNSSLKQQTDELLRGSKQEKQRQV